MKAHGHQKTHMNVPGSTICNRSQMEATQIPINRGMDKQIAAYLYNETVTNYSNTDEIHKQNVEQNKPDTKEYIHYNSIFIKLKNM